MVCRLFSDGKVFAAAIAAAVICLASIGAGRADAKGHGGGKVRGLIRAAVHRIVHPFEGVRARASARRAASGGCAAGACR